MTPASIRTLRARLGLTVEKFAGLLGVSGRTVFRWESGEAPPDRYSALVLGLLQKALDAGGKPDVKPGMSDETLVWALVAAQE